MVCVISFCTLYTDLPNIEIKILHNCILNKHWLSLLTLTLTWKTHTDRETQPTVAVLKLSKGLQTRESSLACLLFIKEESTVSPSVEWIKRTLPWDVGCHVWTQRKDKWQKLGRLREGKGREGTNLLSSGGANEKQPSRVWSHLWRMWLHYKSECVSLSLHFTKAVSQKVEQVVLWSEVCCSVPASEVWIIPAFDKCEEAVWAWLTPNVTNVVDTGALYQPFFNRPEFAWPDFFY